MRNTIIITILLFVAVIGASLYYFANLSGEKKETLRPLTFLPKETLLVTTVQNNETTDNIFKDFEIFGALVGKQELEQWQHLKTKLLRHTAIQPYVNDVDLYVSFHPEIDALSSLFTVPTSSSIDPSTLRDLFRQFSATIELPHKHTLGSLISSLYGGSNDSIVHIIYHEYIFIAFFSKHILYQNIDKRVPKLANQEIGYFIDNNSRNSPL